MNTTSIASIARPRSYNLGTFRGSRRSLLLNVWTWSKCALLVFSDYHFLTLNRAFPSSIRAWLLGFLRKR
jgi:hypothetical protein